MAQNRLAPYLWLLAALAGLAAPGAAEMHEDSATRCVESLGGACIGFNACQGSVVGICHGGQVCCRPLASEPGGGGSTLEPPSNGTAAAGPGDLFYRALPLYDLGCRSDGVYAQLGTLHWFERALELGGRRRLLAGAALDVRGSLFDCALFKRVHAEDADYAWPLANFSLAASPRARYALAAAAGGGGGQAPAGDGEGAAWTAGGAWQGALRHEAAEPAWEQYGAARGRLILYAQNEAAAAGRPGERLVGLLGVRLNGAWHLASTGHARVLSSCGEPGAAPNASLLALEPDGAAPRSQWCAAAPDLRFVADARPLAQQEGAQLSAAAGADAASSAPIVRYSVPEQSPFACLAADSPEALARLVDNGEQGPNGLCLPARQCAHTGGVLGPYVQGVVKCGAAAGDVAGCCIFGPMGGVAAAQPSPEATQPSSSSNSSKNSTQQVQQAPEPIPGGRPQPVLNGSSSPDASPGPKTPLAGRESPHGSNTSQHVRGGDSTSRTRGIFIGLSVGCIALVLVAVLAVYGRRWAARRRERGEAPEESWHLMDLLPGHDSPMAAEESNYGSADEADQTAGGVCLEELSMSSLDSQDGQSSDDGTAPLDDSPEMRDTYDPIAHIYGSAATAARKVHSD
jgi:hypothetical protein